VKRLALLAAVLAALAAAGGWLTMLRMPGSSHHGPLASLGEVERGLREELRRHVEALAGEIGERHVFVPRSLARAAAYLDAALAGAGYRVRRQTYEVAGHPCHNLEVERPGSSRAGEVLVVGAHYDTVIGSPGPTTTRAARPRCSSSPAVPDRARRTSRPACRFAPDAASRPAGGRGWRHHNARRELPRAAPVQGGKTGRTAGEGRPRWTRLDGTSCAGARRDSAAQSEC
jgi:hypothetical protein